MHLIGIILARLLELYFLMLLVRAMLSWVPMLKPDWAPHGVVLAGCEVIYTVTDPPLKLARRVLPPLRIGGIGLDTAFLAVVIVVLVLQRVVVSIF